MANKFDLHLLVAGFSAILGVEVVHPDLGRGLPKLSVQSVFRLTYNPMPLESVDQGEQFDIYVKTLTGQRITVSVTNSFTIAHVKAAIQEKEGIPADQQRLVFSSKVLENGDTIEGAGIPNGGTIFLIIKLRGGGARFQLDIDDLASDFNYDFTTVEDDGKTYKRGKFEYKRPYGWYRYALNVLGKYEDDIWLGKGGIRVDTAPSEWPVSYHGTKFENAEGIAEEGYFIGPRDRYGKGVYSSPYLHIAEGYATRFHKDDKTWKIIFQNRVNPAEDHLRIVNNGLYWLCPKQDPDNNVHDIRPYGVLVREDNHADASCTLI